MDLEEFEQVELAPLEVDGSTAGALKILDSLHNPASRFARRMDLLGDYAGAEFFIIDGESLFQNILSDPLLAIGSEQDVPSFQILHAYFLLEQIVSEFQRRSANFEIAFWHTNFHVTVQTLSSNYRVSSYVLARALLFKHLKSMNLCVHEFQSQLDPKWILLRRDKRPMFIMANDGGPSEGTTGAEAKRLLIQRHFFTSFLLEGLAVVQLKGVTFSDSKILSWVHSSRWLVGFQNGAFRAGLQDTINAALSSLDQSLSAICPPEADSFQLQVPVDHTTPFHTIASWIVSLFLARQKDDTIPLEILYLFALQCVFSRNLTVRDRAQGPVNDLNKNLSLLLRDQMLPDLFLLLAKYAMTYQNHLQFDGRVFAAIIQFAILHPREPVSEWVDSDTYQTTRIVWEALGNPQLNFTGLATRFPHSKSKRNRRISHKIPSPLQLLSFENKVFEPLLEPLNILPTATSDALISQGFGGDIGFQEDKHWHNRRPLLPEHLGGAKPEAVDKRARLRALRSKQRGMARVQQQAETLTGAFGANLERIIIPSLSNSRAPRQVVKQKVTQSKGHEKLSSADKLRQQIKKEKEAKTEDSSMVWWREQLKAMAKLALEQKISQLQALLRNKRREDPAIGTEMKLFRMHLELEQWIYHPDNDTRPVCDQYSVSIMRQVKEICDGPSLTSAELKCIVSVLHALGLSTLAPALLPTPVRSDSRDRLMQFSFIKLAKSKTKELYYDFMAVTEDPIIWQLRLFGEFMDRSMDSASDPRVNFYPDAWQRRVLDCIDANQSLLVVAPTSAGKTFISFYAMEQVLRSTDNGVLVYIAPTKALVNQIAAEVYARFSKNVNGKAFWAIHTRDTRVNDPQNCQILVTVPEILATMFLSPAMARTWTPRIKRIGANLGGHVQVQLFVTESGADLFLLIPLRRRQCISLRRLSLI